MSQCVEHVIHLALECWVVMWIFKMLNISLFTLQKINQCIMEGISWLVFKSRIKWQHFCDPDDYIAISVSTPVLLCLSVCLSVSLSHSVRLSLSLCVSPHPHSYVLHVDIFSCMPKTPLVFFSSCLFILFLLLYSKSAILSSSFSDLATWFSLSQL